jgi:hypothetical protein
MTTAAPPPAPTGQTFPPSLQRYFTAADTLSPDKSLQNIATSAKQLLAGVATVSTVLTGFGLVKAESLHVPWGWYAAAIVLTTVSIALATAATMIHRKALSLDVAEDVEHFFDSEIRWRALAVQASMALYLVALIVAGVGTARYGAPAQTSTPVVRAQWSGVGNAAKLTVSAQIDQADAGTPATLSVTSTRNGAQVMLLSDEATVDASGKASFSDDIADIADVSSVTVVAKAGAQTTTITSGRTLPPPTPTPSPSAK